MNARIAATADVDDSASLGADSSVWHLAQIREGARLGPGCVISRGAYIGSGVRMGRNCKVQNYALLYEPAELGDGVFIGPAAVLTNDTYPRAVSPDGALKRASDWHAVGVSIDDGASIGAGAICIAPLTIGAWALVAAGSVVTRDVPAYGAVAGNPARQIGWVGKTARRLEPGEGDAWLCPDTGEVYFEEYGILSPSVTESSS